MMKELFSCAVECGRRTQSSEVCHIVTLSEFKSDTKMSYKSNDP